MLKHLIAFFAAFVVVWLGTPWVRRLALWLQAVDHPAPRRVNEAPVPRLGGVGVCVGTLLGLRG
jgi:UDP-GlcNAc:undecaprenyl-phosphate/decaprenyl-phosphate GlcNAc-1-phosphate transferase